MLSMASRISIVKMNILPKVNFYVSMLHLPPQLNVWDKIQSQVSHFIWNGQKPRLKNKTLQQGKHLGGLGVPNFELLFIVYDTCSNKMV